MLSKRETDKSGWMFKKGKRVKNWKHRWFELQRDTLEYYEAENGWKPINTIVLTRGARLEVLHDEDAPHDNTFLLHTESRDWMFSVETRKDRDEWMTQIRNNLPSNTNRSIVTSLLPEKEEIVVEGYLHKTGKWNTAWRRRWCKLLPRQKHLLYYEIDESKKKTLKDKIDLNIVTSVPKKVESKSHPHSFELVTADRRYKFAADNEQEMDKWFYAICDCVGEKTGQNLRDKQVLLHLLMTFKEFPEKTSHLTKIRIPDWLWHEVSDMMESIKPISGEEKVDLLDFEIHSPRVVPEDREFYPALVVHLMEDTTALSFEAAMRLLHDVRLSFLSKPLLIDIKGPLFVVGELNGDLNGLLNIFERLGNPPATRYLFLGNVIGVQPQSLGVALLLLAFKLYYPEHVYIIRGKMEDQVQTRSPRGTLYEGCRKQYGAKIGRDLWKEFVWVFDHMQICAVLNNKIFAASSGLSQNLSRVDALRRGSKIRPLYIARTNKKKYASGRLIGSVIVRDFLYNIYVEKVTQYKEQSTSFDKGLVFYEFGKKSLETFLRHNKFTKMVSSGQVNKSDSVIRNGHTSFATMVSVNSSANHNYSLLKNKTVKGAVMFVDEESDDFVFHTFKPDQALLSTVEWSKEKTKSIKKI